MKWQHACLDKISVIDASVCAQEEKQRTITDNSLKCMYLKVNKNDRNVIKKKRFRIYNENLKKYIFLKLANTRLQ